MYAKTIVNLLDMEWINYIVTFEVFTSLFLFGKSRLFSLTKLTVALSPFQQAASYQGRVLAYA